MHDPVPSAAGAPSSAAPPGSTQAESLKAPVRLRVIVDTPERWIVDALLALEQSGVECSLVLVDSPVQDGNGAALGSSSNGVPDAPASMAAAPFDLWLQRGRAGDVDAHLCFDVALVSSRVCAETVPPVWLLTDADYVALDRQYPLLGSITSGEGIALNLCERSAQPPWSWHACRSLHVAAAPRYALGLAGLPGAVARLVRQALIDLRLGVGTHTPGRVCRPPEVPPSRGSPLVRLVDGWWRQWKSVWRARTLAEHWRIGVIDAPARRLLDPGFEPDIRWLTAADRDGYRADPFGLPGSVDIVLCEYFDRRTGMGHLERLQLAPDGTLAGHARLTVGDGSHVSFPQAFSFDGACVGIAETSASRTTTLHAIEPGGGWSPMHALLRDVAAVDPTLFRWQGRVWLACTDADLGEHDSLSLWHADRLEGPWTAHANNPVKVDVRGARMAGAVFEHDGALYRPAQDCLRGYGEAVVLHRIVRCTPTEFEEVEIRRLLPDPSGECPHGLHTVAAWGNRTLVDGKRLRFSGVDLVRKLRSRSNRLRERTMRRDHA